MPPKPQTAVGRTAFIGIDPGMNGGIVCLLPSGHVFHWTMPESELDLWNTFKLIRDYTLPYGKVQVCIEHVTASPQAGVTSMFTFGFGYGRLRLALVAIGFTHELIRPQVWQAALAISSRKKGTREEGPKIGFRKVGGESDKDWKERLRVKAQQLFPNLEVWKGTKKSQYAISDALLIAEFCKRKFTGVIKDEEAVS